MPAPEPVPGASSGDLPITTLLAALPDKDLDELYADPAAARFVLRQLEPLAQQFVMRLLFSGPRAFQEAMLRKWAAPGASEACQRSLDSLRRFRVTVEAQMPKPATDKRGVARQLQREDTGVLLQLHRCLYASLATHLLEATAPLSIASGGEPSAEQLLHYAVSRWDRFLTFLTESGKSVSEELNAVVDRLQLKELGQLTAQGFRFVLDDRQQQLWALVTSFLEKARQQHKHVGPLRLLLGLAEARVGDFVPQEKLREEQCLVQLLTDVGVLCRAPEAMESRRGPGHLATLAALAMFRQDASAALSRSIAGTTGDPGLPMHLYRPATRPKLDADNGGLTRAADRAAPPEEQGIIVESNFKVYAYTANSLHVRLIGHFCRIIVRLPHLVVGVITPEKVLQAMKRGIRAESLLRYLESAAHPRALKRQASGNPVVPGNVCGQIEVWESNRRRTTTFRAVLFEWEVDEIEAGAFERLRKQAEADDTLLWCRAEAAIAGGGLLSGGRSIRPRALAVKATGAARMRMLCAKEAEAAAVSTRAPVTGAAATASQGPAHGGPQGSASGGGLRLGSAR